MEPMTREEYRAFMSSGTRTAKLATTRRDGRPHVAPVWFVMDGDDLLFNTGEQSVKGRNIRRDPRLAVCVDDERPPYSFVLVEGDATIISDPAEVLDVATRCAARYMGEELAAEYGKRNSGQGELAVRITPGKIVAEMGIAD
jgi:hypothetical protein